MTDIHQLSQTIYDSVEVQELMVREVELTPLRPEPDAIEVGDRILFRIDLLSYQETLSEDEFSDLQSELLELIVNGLPSDWY